MNPHFATEGQLLVASPKRRLAVGTANRARVTAPTTTSTSRDQDFQLLPIIQHRFGPARGHAQPSPSPRGCPWTSSLSAHKTKEGEARRWHYGWDWVGEPDTRLPLNDHLRESRGGGGGGQEEGASDALFGGNTSEGWGRGLVHCLSVLCSSAINSARAQEHVSAPGGTGPDLARWVFPMAKTMDLGQLMAVAAGNVVRLTTETLRLRVNDLTFLACPAVPKCNMGQNFGKMLTICVGGQKEGGPTILSHFCLPQHVHGARWIPATITQTHAATAFRGAKVPPRAQTSSPIFSRARRHGKTGSSGKGNGLEKRVLWTWQRDRAKRQGKMWQATPGVHHLQDRKVANPLQTGQRAPRPTEPRIRQFASSRPRFPGSKTRQHGGGRRVQRGRSRMTRRWTCCLCCCHRTGAIQAAQLAVGPPWLQPPGRLVSARQADACPLAC